MLIRPMYAVLERELLRMFRQRTRLVAAIVRPLIWLFVIGAGFAGVIGAGHGIDYRNFLVPGVLGMTMLFGGMLAALTTVYDKESGVMRMMIIAPMPHAWIVIAKVISAAAVAVLQALLLLALLAAIGYAGPGPGWWLLPFALLGTALACAATGMLIASFTRTLDNFAGVMNFVIFPVFFLSGSLYPVHNLPALLQSLARANPYTYGVDLLKHALLPQAAMSADFSAGVDLSVLAGATAIAVAVASWRFSREPAYGPMIHALTRGTQ